MIQRRNLRLDWLLLQCIVILTVIEFSSFLTSGSFGSEFTQFYMFVHDRSFGHIMQWYISFTGHWYRPTQFFLPYWIGEHFISWHNPHGWRAYELFTVLMVCGLIYWFVLVLLPGRRIAAFTAALYFTCVPVIYAPLYELAAFDFFHIVFSLLSAIAFTIGYRLRTWRGVGGQRWRWYPTWPHSPAKRLQWWFPSTWRLFQQFCIFTSRDRGKRKLVFFAR